jgi:carbohydrate-binding DOMON domain-containing protein
MRGGLAAAPASLAASAARAVSLIANEQNAKAITAIESMESRRCRQRAGLTIFFIELTSPICRHRIEPMVIRSSPGD